MSINKENDSFAERGSGRDSNIGFKRSGRTTRIVDDCIQELFTLGKCQCIDHFGTSKASVEVFNKVLDRLRFEHRLNESSIIIDKSVLKIYIKNF